MDELNSLIVTSSKDKADSKNIGGKSVDFYHGTLVPGAEILISWCILMNTLKSPKIAIININIDNIEELKFF